MTPTGTNQPTGCQKAHARNCKWRELPHLARHFYASALNIFTILYPCFPATEKTPCTNLLLEWAEIRHIFQSQCVSIHLTMMKSWYKRTVQPYLRAFKTRDLRAWASLEALGCQGHTGSTMISGSELFVTPKKKAS